MLALLHEVYLKWFYYIYRLLQRATTTHTNTHTRISSDLNHVITSISILRPCMSLCHHVSLSGDFLAFGLFEWCPFCLSVSTCVSAGLPVSVWASAGWYAGRFQRLCPGKGSVCESLCESVFVCYTCLLHFTGPWRAIPLLLLLLLKGVISTGDTGTSIVPGWFFFF